MIGDIHNRNKEIPKDLLKLKKILDKKKYESYFSSSFPAEINAKNDIVLIYFDNIMADYDISQCIININNLTLFRDIEDCYDSTGKIYSYIVKGKYAYIEKYDDEND